MTHIPPSPHLPPNNWHLQETYKSLITISVECLKMLVVVNGGAAVAVLTYLGNLVGRSSPQHPIHITPAILCYCGGLLAAVLALMFSYLVQLRLYNEESAVQWNVPVRRRHGRLLWMSIALAIIAAAAFGMGCWSAAEVLGA